MITLAVVQFTPEHNTLDANLSSIESAIRTIDAHIIVLPELATTGYFYREPAELDGLAMTSADERLQHLLRVASEHQRVVVFGFAERDGSKLFNSAMVGGYGTVQAVYRKTHLFYREKDVFQPGDSGFFVTPIPHLDCNLGTMICYDWRFPESARTLALRGADVIAAPSNLVTELWPKVMPSRAAENKVYLAVANRVGTETNAGGSVEFNGMSTIYNYNGEILNRVSNDVDHYVVITAEIDPPATRKKSFNAYNDIFADRRPELYE